MERDPPQAASDAANEFQFRSRAPCAVLAPFVEQLWYARGQIAYQRDHILPHGSAVLLVNLGAPHATSPAGHRGPPLLLRESWICGLQSGPLANEPLGETHVVGASFAPAGAAAFVGEPMSALTDGVVSLDALWGNAATALRERLLDEPSPEGKLECLESGLLGQLLSIPPRGLVRIEAALRRLLVPGPAGIAAVAEEVDLSRKQLIAAFHRLIGISPGRLARIGRLNRLITELDARHRIPWAELAEAHGWADQSHLIRDFKRFAGVTPQEYVDRRREVFGLELQPGQDTVFLPQP